LRFFKERRIAISFVDLAVKPIAAGELNRFVSGHGARALLDEDSRAYRESGLGYMRFGEAELIERLMTDQRLIKLPLVRSGHVTAVGADEPSWKKLIALAG
jgi:arsenate reductase-like glutaredoxin family protein